MCEICIVVNRTQALILEYLPHHLVALRAHHLVEEKAVTVKKINEKTLFELCKTSLSIAFWSLPHHWEARMVHLMAAGMAIV